ncbi:MAG TPA: hypothetical protein VMT88_06500 [Actinomycetes bacterium]|nr:hypothetical protein [Actinomycetes bacterium]
MTNEAAGAGADLAEACPRCGSTTTGRYCSACGFALGFVAETRTVVPAVATPTARRISVPLPSWKSLLLVLSGALALGAFQFVAGADERDAIDACKEAVGKDAAPGQLTGFHVVRAGSREFVVGVGSPPTNGAGTSWQYACSVGNDGVLYQGGGTLG